MDQLGSHFLLKICRIYSASERPVLCHLPTLAAIPTFQIIRTRFQPHSAGCSDFKFCLQFSLLNSLSALIQHTFGLLLLSI